MVINSALFIGHVRDTLIASERRQIIQAWQLEQLVPVRAAEPGSRVSDPSVT